MDLNFILDHIRRYWLEICLFFLVATASLVGLEDRPPIWWDEGWTLMVARNWVEQGHYGLFQDGLPRDAGLSGHFPMVAMVALSFRLFGTGVWQGRLPTVLTTIAVAALLYHFSKKWWGRRIALITGFASFILYSPAVNVFIYGKQTLGEVPAICFLLAGYACLEMAFKRTRFWLLATAIFWGLCIGIKSQPLPFWFASVLLYSIASIINHQRRKSGWLLLPSIGALLIYQSLRVIPSMLNKPIIGNPEIIEGLMNITGIVPDINTRLLSILMVVRYGLLTLLGLSWAGWHLWKEISNKERLIYPDKWAMWGFASSWFAWYLLLGMFWSRYLFPAVLVASPFIVASLSSLTKEFDLKWLMQQSARLLTGHELRLGLKALCCLLVLTITLTVNLKDTILNEHESSLINPQAAAIKLENIIPANALVETYESEIMFLAPTVRFHYPPDQISIEAVEKLTIDPGRSLDYDPLQANPDYLLLGFFNESWKVYDEVIIQGLFKLQESFFGYDLYYRVR
jgi:hypothetical protein